MNAKSVNSSSEDLKVVDLFTRTTPTFNDYSRGMYMSYSKEESSSGFIDKDLVGYMQGWDLRPNQKNIEPPHELGYNIYSDGHKYSTRNSKEGDEMSNINWQEKYIESLNDNIKEIKEGFISTENRIADMINKHIEYSTHLDKQRHEEILEINRKIESVSSEISATNKWIIGLVITTIVGVAAMIVTPIFAR